MFNTQYVSTLINNYLKGMPSISLISKVTIKHTSNKITIHFLYYNPFSSLSDQDMMNLTSLLEQYYHQKVEVTVNQLRYPFMNADILAQYLVLNSDKARFKFIKRAVYRQVVMNPSMWNHMSVYMTGIKVDINGRLINEKIIPRKTTLTMSKGTLTPTAIKGHMTYIDKGSHTFKNQHGSFTISVTIAQVIKS